MGSCVWVRMSRPGVADWLQVRLWQGPGKFLTPVPKHLDLSRPTLTDNFLRVKICILQLAAYDAGGRIGECMCGDGDVCLPKLDVHSQKKNSPSLTARLISWPLPTYYRTTDGINLQIKCLWLLLIYRSEPKSAVCVHECVRQLGCVLMACIKKSNNLTDGEGPVRSGLCDGEQSLRLDCSRSTRQTWQGEGYRCMCVCVKWEEGVV